MLCERNVAAFSCRFINRFCLFSCNMSKYKFLVEATGKDSRDSSQMQATLYMLFCLCENEKQGVDINMSLFMGEKCLEPARTGCCAQNLSDITGDVTLWYCLTGVFTEMAILAKEKENAKSQ